MSVLLGPALGEDEGPPDGTTLGVELKGKVVRCSDGATEGCAANLLNREADR